MVSLLGLNVPSSLNVPQRFHLPIILLRLLCLIPAGLGILRNGSRAWTQPLYDEGGVFENKSTPLIHSVSLFWCALAGYWSWILTTSMLRRWLYHYELSNALVRLITLTVINWSISAFVSSHYGRDQPIWKWMTICCILLVANVLKIILASSSKYQNKTEHRINHRSTVVRVLVLPLTIVVFLTMFATQYQVSEMRAMATTALASTDDPATLAARVDHPELPDQGNLRVMVLVLSSWTASSLERRQTFRESTLQLMHAGDGKATPGVSYMYRFVIGNAPTDKPWYADVARKLEAEMATHQDILQVPASDTYDDLSKKVYAMLKWADTYQFDYLIKTDDDVFVRWDTLTDELRQQGATRRYWRGLAWWNIPPIRSLENKNADYTYPLPIFPPFTAGALYILSRDVVHLVAGPPGPPMFVRNEDQNLGIWLFPHNIRPIHDRRIQQLSVCEEDMIAKHFGNVEDPDSIGGTMQDMLANIRQGRKMCAGFRTGTCGHCYPCHGKDTHWKKWGFDCHPEKGISLLHPPPWTVVD